MGQERCIPGWTGRFQHRNPLVRVLRCPHPVPASSQGQILLCPPSALLSRAPGSPGQVGSETLQKRLCELHKQQPRSRFLSSPLCSRSNLAGSSVSTERGLQLALGDLGLARSSRAGQCSKGNRAHECSALSRPRPFARGEQH